MTLVSHRPTLHDNLHRNHNIQDQSCENLENDDREHHRSDVADVVVTQNHLSNQSAQKAKEIEQGETDFERTKLLEGFLQLVRPRNCSKTIDGQEQGKEDVLINDKSSKHPSRDFNDLLGQALSEEQQHEAREEREQEIQQIEHSHRKNVDPGARLQPPVRLKDERIQDETENEHKPNREDVLPGWDRSEQRVSVRSVLPSQFVVVVAI